MHSKQRKVFVMVSLFGLIGVSVMTTATWAEGGGGAPEPESGCTSLTWEGDAPRWQWETLLPWTEDAAHVIYHRKPNVNGLDCWEHLYVFGVWVHAECTRVSALEWDGYHQHQVSGELIPCHQAQAIELTADLCQIRFRTWWTPAGHWDGSGIAYRIHPITKVLDPTCLAELEEAGFHFELS